MQYVFSFYFTNAQVSDDKRQATITSWGGNLGTAFSRSWKYLRSLKAYKDIKKLTPDSVGINIVGDQKWGMITRLVDLKQEMKNS